ncbi:nucleotidyltransferase family protein [Qipengyuania sp. SS22]|uniref:nucleotidyltransferase family protein n=1 Tax=Qipengyuania sp. SS22 TaxID=2979461 RepID=UPI0021E5EEFD|nr:nucleotidyltransferase family protein [Qipengyuania sp. SS22]UYH55013.1 nucleotidyltransferase family protein [Qipengyuania sp. SS22]
MPPIDPGVGFIFLAAGRGKRFGRDKLTQDFRGQPLWSWVALAAEEAGFAQRYIVSGPHSAIPARSGWHAVTNDRAAEGMGTSIAAGVRAAQDCSRVVIALADMPFVEPAHLRLLAETGGPVFTRYASGAEGSPAGFPRSIFDRLCALQGEAGARSLGLADASAIAPASAATLADIDTPEDLLALSSQNPAGRR